MIKNNTNKQIIVNTFSGWGVVIVRSLIAVIMIPVLLDAVGKDGFGLIGLLGVFVSLSNIADLGLRQALGRELSEQIARKDEDAFFQLTSTALLLYAIIAIFLATLGFLIAPLFVSWMKVPYSLIEQAIDAVRLYGCFAIIISFITPIFSSGLTARLRFDLVNQIQIVTSAISNLVLFILLMIIPNHALNLWVWIMLLNMLVVCTLNIVFFKKICCSERNFYFSISFKRLKPLLKLGGYMYLLQVTFSIMNQSAPLVISSFFGTSGVALYHPGGRISELLRPLVLTLTNQLYPLTTKHKINENDRELGKILVWGTKYTFMMGVLTSSALFTLADPLCKLWLSASLGDSYKTTAEFMKCWALIDILTYLTGSQMAILLGLKDMKFLVWSQVPTAIISIFLAIYFVGHTSIGINGVLYGSILMNLIRRPLLMWYTAKRCRVKFIDYLRKSYIGSLAVLILLVGLGQLFFSWFEIKSIFGLFIFSFSYGAVWLLLVYLMVLSHEERLRIASLISKNNPSRTA